jgi:hypothetical protein
MGLMRAIASKKGSRSREEEGTGGVEEEATVYKWTRAAGSPITCTCEMPGRQRALSFSGRNGLFLHCSLLLCAASAFAVTSPPSFVRFAAAAAEALSSFPFNTAEFEDDALELVLSSSSSGTYI